MLFATLQVTARAMWFLATITVATCLRNCMIFYEQLSGNCLHQFQRVRYILFRRRNNISELPKGLFRKQSRLREIDLPRNEIRKLNRGVFRFASRVEVLNLERNLLERLEENVFAGLVNVTQLYLARNQLMLIDPTAFKELAKLEVLDLKANRLRDEVHL